MARTCLLLLLGLLLSGVVPTDGDSRTADATTAHAADPPALKIVVPDEVRQRWHSVDISILDLDRGTESTHTISIGDSYQIPDSTLSLQVQIFLPAFIMNSGQMTSASNDPRNPAAYVTIRDGGEKVFTGWLFSLYPDAHAFKNPRYHFTLTGYNQRQVQ